MQSDAVLLAEWTARRSEVAFARLVERYVALVHSAARRQVSDPHLAEEITQAVFVLLARKAGSLGRQTVLPGWLCRTAYFAARDALRAERRRQHREQLAATMQTPDAPPDAAWQQLAPLLDEAVAQLREADRNAIVLRYYEQRPLEEVGVSLGVGADAAQKRVARALEKLRSTFTKRGVMLTGAAIASAVSTNAVQAVPVGLAAKISAASALGGTTITAAIAIVMTTLQKTIIGAALAAAIGWGIYETRQATNARREVRTLEQEQTALATQSTRARAEGMHQPALALDSEEQQRTRKEHLELLSLRGRVTQLANELRQHQHPASPRPAAVPTEQDTDSILFGASLTNRVASGRTLVVGGWSMAGKRGYLLLTPVIHQNDSTPDSERVTVRSQVVVAPESFWSQIGWADARSEARRSTLAGVLLPEQLELLLATLKGTKDAELSNTSLAKGRDGERVGIGFSLADDKETGALMGIDLYPHITPDGQTVNLEIRPSVVSTNTQIHSSLIQAGQVGSPGTP